MAPHDGALGDALRGVRSLISAPCGAHRCERIASVDEKNRKSSFAGGRKTSGGRGNEITRGRVISLPTMPLPKPAYPNSKFPNG